LSEINPTALSKSKRKARWQSRFNQRGYRKVWNRLNWKSS